MDKKKIKGISKKHMHYAGFILASALMIGFSPQKVSANDYNIAYEQESDKETDFEKYFSSDIPMNNQNQITTESEIYKILSFYEGGIKSETGEFEIQLDPAYNLVVASGLTIKFQEPLVNYLSETYSEDSDKVLESVEEKIKSGEKVTIPSNIIEECFIEEIQSCRNSVIDSAENLNISLGESQINVLTELNYRYGQKQSEAFLKFVLEGNNIENYTVHVLRSMPEEQWETFDTNIHTEVVSKEDGIVNYYAYEKPFGALKEFDGSISELANLDIKSEVEETEMQFNGDKRRALFRQIGIMYDVCPIIINNEGICRYTIDEIAYESSLLDYLSNYEKNQNIDEQELENTLITVIDEIKQSSNSTEVNEVLEIFQDDSSMKIKQEKENGQAEGKETALIPVEEKKKFNIFKVFATLGGAALMALGVRKAKNAITKEKEDNKVEEKTPVKLKDKREAWLKNIKINIEEDTHKVHKMKARLKVLFEVVDRRENELPKFFKFSDNNKKELYRDAKKEITKYKTKSVHTKEEKERYREARDYEIILQNENLVKKISKIKKTPRRFIHEQLKRDVYNYRKRKETEKNNIEEQKETTERTEKII